MEEDVPPQKRQEQQPRDQVTPRRFGERASDHEEAEQGHGRERTQDDQGPPHRATKHHEQDIRFSSLTVFVPCPEAR